jgi:putative DNA primase/helicase
MSDAADKIAASALGVEVDRHGSHARFAYRLARRYGGRLINIHGVGWHVWDGNRWKLDVHEAAATRAVLETLRAAWPEMAEMENKERAALTRDIRSCETATGAAGVLALAGRLEPLSATVDRVDADPYAFNTPGGTYDLLNPERGPRPPDPADLITKLAGAAPLPTPRPAFDAFMEHILPDPEIRAFVQRLLGSALCGKVRDHVLPIFKGEGANGKSTLENVIRAVFGEYGINVDSKLLMTQRFDGIPTEKMDLMGVRLVYAHETAQGRELDAAGVKALTGGDPIHARRMRQDPVEFMPSHTLVMVTNHLPRVPADDPALWRRLLVVPFDVVIPEKHWDLELPDKLVLELSGIAQWLLDGYRRYAEIGLCRPMSVSVATNRYQVESDALGRFIDEQCVVQGDGGAPLCAPAGELYGAYAEWCRLNREEALPAKEFRPAMERRGFTWKRSMQARIYQGIMLRQTKDQYGRAIPDQRL